MHKKITIFVAICLLFLILGPVNVSAAETSPYDGQIVKMEGLPTLYYVMEGKRYVFPNQKIYDSWFLDFNDVKTLPAETIYSLPLAGNVHYRPGVVMVKINTDPKVYAVANNGELRWVKTEAMAREMYGDDWNQLIDDVPDSFFTNYRVGAAIEKSADYNPDNAADENDSIEKNHGKAYGHAKRAQTVKCRAIPATPATPGHKNGKTTPATPATPARVCKNAIDDDKNDTDKTAPVISALTVTDISSTTAKVSWTTNEDATGLVMYATGSLSAAATSSITTLTDTAKTKAHSFNLTGLVASTTYYYMVKSSDASGNLATSSESTFKTIE